MPLLRMCNFCNDIVVVKIFTVLQCNHNHKMLTFCNAHTIYTLALNSGDEQKKLQLPIFYVPPKHALQIAYQAKITLITLYVNAVPLLITVKMVTV